MPALLVIQFLQHRVVHKIIVILFSIINCDKDTFVCVRNCNFQYSKFYIKIQIITKLSLMSFYPKMVKIYNYKNVPLRRFTYELYIYIFEGGVAL